MNAKTNRTTVQIDNGIDTLASALTVVQGMRRKVTDIVIAELRNKVAFCGWTTDDFADQTSQERDRKAEQKAYNLGRYDALLIELAKAKYEKDILSLPWTLRQKRNETVADVDCFTMIDATGSDGVAKYRVRFSGTYNNLSATLSRWLWVDAKKALKALHSPTAALQINAFKDAEMEAQHAASKGSGSSNANGTAGEAASNEVALDADAPGEVVEAFNVANNFKRAVQVYSKYHAEDMSLIVEATATVQAIATTIRDALVIPDSEDGATDKAATG